MHRPVLLRLTCAAAVLSAACGRDERLSIELVTPEPAELDPTLDERLSAITLVDERREVVMAEQPFTAGQKDVVFPALPLDFRGDLRIELLDSGKRILGLGRVVDARFASYNG